MPKQCQPAPYTARFIVRVVMGSYCMSSSNLKFCGRIIARGNALLTLSLLKCVGSTEVSYFKRRPLLWPTTLNVTVPMAD